MSRRAPADDPSCVDHASDQPRLGELLVRAGVLDRSSLAKGLAEHERTGRPLGMTLVELGCVSEQVLMSTLAHQLGLPVARITAWPVDPEVLELVPRELAEKHRCLPLALKDEGSQQSLYLAMVDPSDLDGLEAVRAHSGREVRVVLVAPSELDAALGRHYRGTAPEPPPARGTGEAQRARPEDPEFLHHWSVSREEVLALLSEDPMVEEPSGSAAKGAHEIRAALDRRRLQELDDMVKLVMQLLIDTGLISRDDLVRRLSALAH
jgi:type II secretion system (T2SS) protein E